MSRQQALRVGIGYGAAVGCLIGAVCALIDGMTAVWFGFCVPYALPAVIVAGYLLIGTLGGATLGGVYVVLRRGRTGANPAAMRVSIREACLMAWTGLFVLFLLERSLQAEVALAITGAGLLAALALRWKLRACLASETACVWQIACLAAMLVWWYPIKIRGGELLFGSRYLIPRYVAFVGAVAGCYFMGRMALRRLPALNRANTAHHCLVRATTIALVALVAGLAITHSRTIRPLETAPVVSATAPGVQRPNVVLVTLDTVRADHLSLHGYHRQTSPNLEDFARQAACYERAIATSSWTVPSHASMFTGLMPSEHGARFIDAGRCQTDADGKSWAVWRRSGELAHPLAEDNVTLAEILSAHGYRTAAIVGNTGGLHRNWQLCQGFAYYDDRDTYSPRTYRCGAVTPVTRVARLIQDMLGGPRSGCRTAEEVNRDTLAWLDANPGRPFFLFVNYIDAHSPYESHPGYTFSGSPTDFPPDSDSPAKAYSIPTEQVPRLDRYDSEVAYVDAQFGALMKALRARGLYEDSLIIVLSDHGEAFGEHGWLEHGKSLYQEELWVPMLVRYAGG